MKPNISLFYLGRKLEHFQECEELMRVRTDNVLSRYEWDLQTIFNDLNNPDHNNSLIIFDRLGFQYFLATPKIVQLPTPETFQLSTPVNNQHQNVHIVAKEVELIIPWSSTGCIRKYEDGSVTFWDVNDKDSIIATGGNLARALWDYALSKVETTITGELEEWQEDLTYLDYRQLLALAGLIIATDRQPLDADYDIEIDVADDEQLELPTYLLHHVAKIGRVGRAKFLVDVANALANLARPVEDEQETEILSPAQPESTND